MQEKQALLRLSITPPPLLNLQLPDTSSEMPRSYHLCTPAEHTTVATNDVLQPHTLAQLFTDGRRQTGLWRWFQDWI